MKCANRDLPDGPPRRRWRPRWAPGRRSCAAPPRRAESERRRFAQVSRIAFLSASPILPSLFVSYFFMNFLRISLRRSDQASRMAFFSLSLNLPSPSLSYFSMIFFLISSEWPRWGRARTDAADTNTRPPTSNMANMRYHISHSPVDEFAASRVETPSSYVSGSQNLKFELVKGCY